MDCNDCCQNDLGCFPHNKEIDTGLTAPEAGIYKFFFSGPNFTKFEKILYFGAGQAIKIAAGVLNEDFQYRLQIEKPDGTFWSQDDCEFFAIKTFINTISCDDEYFDYL